MKCDESFPAISTSKQDRNPLEWNLALPGHTTDWFHSPRRLKQLALPTCLCHQSPSFPFHSIIANFSLVGLTFYALDSREGEEKHVHLSAPPQMTDHPGTTTGSWRSLLYRRCDPPLESFFSPLLATPPVGLRLPDCSSFRPAKTHYENP
jgi:hypothetical protein